MGEEVVLTRVKVDDAFCGDCDEAEIYLDVKEEPSIYKVGATCEGCDRDYGVLGRIPRTEISHLDEVGERAEEIVQRYLD